MTATVKYIEWETLFDRRVETVLTNATKIHEAAAKELKHRIEERTPVGNPALWKYPAPAGYTPGTLKASWEFKNGVNGEFIISNDQPYADRVEHGWSTQAPTGMLRISLLEWNSIVQTMKARIKL